MHYTSNLQLFNLPLLQIAVGPQPSANRVRGTAKAWIAVGDIAIGVLLSAGGVAVGGIAVGGISFGVLSVGGLAFGAWALGGGAGGWLAAGGAAVAIVAALGGFAAAGDYAVGGAAYAPEANTATAQTFVEHNAFFNAAQIMMARSRWLLVLAAVPVVYALVRRIRQRREEPPGRA